MNVNELIAELIAMRAAGYGDLPIVVEDGMDPSDIVEAGYAELSTHTYWFSATRGGAEHPCIRIT